MDIFILFICVVGFLIIYGKDKIGAANYDRKEAQVKQSRYRFVSRVYNEDRFWSIRDFLMLHIGRPGYEEKSREIYREVADAYREMEWGDLDYYGFLGFLDRELYRVHIVETILLANRGMMSDWDAGSGIHFDPRSKWAEKNVDSPFPRVQRGSDRDQFERQLRHDKALGHFVVKKLREHGVDEGAYFVPDISIRDYYHLDSVYRFGSEPDKARGTLFFYPSLLASYQDYISKNGI